MLYPKCSSLLKSYFSNITYIDDQFDTSLIDEPLEGVWGENSEEIPVPDDGCDSDNLFNGVFFETEGEEVNFNPIVNDPLSQIFLKIGAEEDYNEIQLSPVLFTKDINEEFLIKKMQRAPLSVIDWELSDGKTAYPIVSRLFQQSKQLKVVVVYTNSFLEAEGALKQDISFSTYKKIDYESPQILCYQNKHKSLLIIASKQKYNLKTLLNTIVELYLSCCGLMPSVLFSVVNQINEQSGNLFEAFCKPFEDVYFLQLYFSQLNIEDMQNLLAQFILNKVQSGIKIDKEILKEMHQSAQSKLVKISELPNHIAYECIRTSLAAIKPYLTNTQKEICCALEAIPYGDYKPYFLKMKEPYTSWNEVLQEFSTLLSKAFKAVCQKKCDKFFQPYYGIEIPDKKKEIEINRRDIEQLIKEKYKPEYDAFKKEVWPVYIQILISGSDILQSSAELVYTMKYHAYSNECLSVLLQDGEIPREREKFLVNQIHFGDILIKDIGEHAEYLLCITPPCDIFRPNKVELMVTFIQGQIIPYEKLQVERKENVHISALPCIDDHGSKCLKYISWRYFDLKKFDLKDDDTYKELSTYRRPYMLDEQYMRQIANKFTAYFSRAGVEEIFMKEEKSLMKIFS